MLDFSFSRDLCMSHAAVYWRVLRTNALHGVSLQKTNMCDTTFCDRLIIESEYLNCCATIGTRDLGILVNKKLLSNQHIKRSS